MIRFFILPVLFALTSSTPAFAGGLYLEVSNPADNAAAKSMQALAVVRSTACHNPAKSVITASLVDSDLHRTPLQVVPFSTPGTFAILGTLPQGIAVIDIGVSNPEYKNYQAYTLIRASGSNLEWASVKRLFGTAATDRDMRAMFNRP